MAGPVGDWSHRHGEECRRIAKSEWRNEEFIRTKLGDECRLLDISLTHAHLVVAILKI
jgi:hypothetical protein